MPWHKRSCLIFFGKNQVGEEDSYWTKLVDKAARDTFILLMLTTILDAILIFIV